MRLKVPERRAKTVSEGVAVSNYVHYHLVYYVDNGEFAEIQIDFEYADDFHVTVEAKNWLKYAWLSFGDTDLNNTEEHLKKFFAKHTGKVDLEEDMDDLGILYSVAYWY